MGIFIIAEAGVNHNRDMGIARGLIDAAVEAGADAVKFQTFKAENVISAHAKKADYQIENTGSAESQLEMVKKLELSYDQFTALRDYCNARGILFLSTPFDLESVDYLHSIGMPIFKIPSGEVTNLPHMLKIARLGRPVIMSTGMCELLEVRFALETLEQNGAGEVTLLHCNTEYPTPYADANLRAIETLRREFPGHKVGFSDHTLGPEAAVAAAAMGAAVIEKHITLDHNMEGPDHLCSLEPHELAAMVKSIRRVEEMLGTGVKEPTPSERKNIEIARKSILAKTAIRKGEIFTEDNLTVKRPGSGISPLRWYDVIGSAAARDFQPDELIEL